MNHTECKDCELSNNDCGHHFKMNGKINYDIASLSACDQYGNCEFFQQKERPQGDLISRSYLKQMIPAPIEDEYKYVHQIIDNAPPVDAYPFEQLQELVKLNQQFAQKIENLEKPQPEWVTDELCRLRSCLRSGTHVGSYLQTPAQMDRFIKALDEVIKPN